MHHARSMFLVRGKLSVFLFCVILACLSWLRVSFGRYGRCRVLIRLPHSKTRLIVLGKRRSVLRRTSSVTAVCNDDSQAVGSDNSSAYCTDLDVHGKSSGANCGEDINRPTRLCRHVQSCPHRQPAFILSTCQGLPCMEPHAVALP